jgi:hypothetical protein
MGQGRLAGAVNALDGDEKAGEWMAAFHGRQQFTFLKHKSNRTCHDIHTHSHFACE